MPKIRYEDKNFNSETLAIIQNAVAIVTEYEAQGYSLTLRQLYYQFVARGIIPNNERSYKRIGNIVSDARRAGLIDWNSIEDRTRYLRKLSSWDDPQGVLLSAKSSYHIDWWENQAQRIEVWIEKDALVGVIQQVCSGFDVSYFSCRGYVSDSEMWVAGRRIVNYNRAGQHVLVLHLGDHDPSGIDMTRDITDRLNLFSRHGDFEVRRIALTMEQVEEVSPPPNPAKITDSRAQGYIERYGTESWELDALEPSYLDRLIRENIQAELDNDKLKERKAIERFGKGQIQWLIDNFEDIPEDIEPEPDEDED